MFEARIKLGQYLYLKHGAKVVFLGRFVALLRILAAFLAGVNRMPWRAFLIANASGGIIWAAVFGIGGYFFGKLLLQLHHALAPFVFALALAAFFGCGYLIRRYEDRLTVLSDATRIGLQYWPNARYPAPSLQRSMRRGYRASPLYLVTLGPHEASGTIVTRVSIFQQSAGLLSEAICVAPWLIHARVCLLLIATAVIDPVVLKSARHVGVAFRPR